MTAPIVILTGGEAATPPALPASPRTVIAADSGLHLAERLGVTVDLIVGDLDSAHPEAVATAIEQGATVEQHPADKDATDLDLALDAARAAGGGRVIVIGGVAGRIDHWLATAALLASERHADLAIEWWSGSSRAYVVRDAVDIEGQAGDLLSIVPASGAITASVEGVRWPLDEAQLEYGSTRGVSNEVLGDTARVSITSGTAYVIHTARGEHP